MPSNAREFQRELSRVTKDFTEPELVLFHKRLALDALRRVILKTPVDTGRTRGNWQATIGSPASGTVDTPDKTGGSTITKAAATVEAIVPFSAFFLTNNVPHILVLEEGLFQPSDPGPSADKREDRFGRVLVQGGFSVQAPAGMVSETIAELQAIFGP